MIQNKVVLTSRLQNFGTTKTHHKIQCAYCSHTQVTLFMVCIREINGIHLMLIVPDSLHHDHCHDPSILMKMYNLLNLLLCFWMMQQANLRNTY